MSEAPEAVVVVDVDGRVVAPDDPRAARILRGPDAERALAAARGATTGTPADASAGEPTTPRQSKARKAPPEDK